VCSFHDIDSITAVSSSMMPSAPSPATHIVSSASVTADKVRAQQIKEQQEMQLLERRIREAAGQGMIGTHTHTSSSAHDITTGGKVDRSLQQLEELNRERESEYRTLAARYNADDTKDTVHDAERNRGTYVRLHVLGHFLHNS
jgi:protein subunit release factor B